MEEVTLKISGMTCGGCVNSVTSVLKPIEGVSDVKVTLEPGEAIIKFDPTKTSVEAFQDAIDGAGFDVVN